MLTVARTREYEAYDSDVEEYYLKTEEEEVPATSVGVYVTTRHYGGSEEGGWWYNRTVHVLSIPLLEPGSEAEYMEVVAFLRPRFPDQGNIYSVNGGEQYDMRPEHTPGQYADTVRPRYE